MTVECLITGCKLFDENSGRQVHGDLHRVTGAYVFNACLEDGEAAWAYNGGRPSDKLILTIHPETHFFERRGVIVVSVFGATLSPEAKDYVNK